MPDRSVTVGSPAKLNLALAVTNRRTDGYHELISVVWRTCWGDTIRLKTGPSVQQDKLHCDMPGVPLDETNLVMRAITRLRQESNLEDHFEIILDKKIPLGSGLGGGSSNAAAVLRVLRDLYPERIGTELVMDTAAELGSDCTLFLQDGPCWMQGRGEICHLLPAELVQELSGTRVWVVVPEIEVPTMEAYRRLAEAKAYSPQGIAESALRDWIQRRPARELLPRFGNDFERIMPDWMPTFSVVLSALNELRGTWARLSGSGSAIFILPGKGQMENIIEILENAWGDSFLLARTMLE